MSLVSQRPGLKRQSTAPASTQTASSKKPRVWDDITSIVLERDASAGEGELVGTAGDAEQQACDSPTEDMLHDMSGSSTLVASGRQSHSPVTHSNAEGLSMSRRRQAANRPSLNLHVHIPPPSLSFSHINHPVSTSQTQSPASATASTSQRSFFMRLRSNPDSIPATPTDQRIHTPLEPPEIPRTIDPRRNAVFNRRWAPTPTEEVYPIVCFATVTATSSSPVIAGDASGSEDNVPSPSTEPLVPRDRGPLSPVQRRLCFSSHLSSPIKMKAGF